MSSSWLQSHLLKDGTTTREITALSPTIRTLGKPRSLTRFDFPIKAMRDANAFTRGDVTMQDQLIADVIAVADGEIIGRIRLQKIFYLLEQAGLGSGLSLHYHHYGPYSRELDDAVSRAQAFNAVKEEIRHRQVDGMPYSVFTLSGGEKAPVKIGRIRVDPARELIRAMKDASSTVLELAATIYWLVKR